MDPLRNLQVSFTTTNSNQTPSFYKMLIPSPATAFLIAVFIVGLLLNGDTRPLVKRGFFCGDSSINYPHEKDTVGIKTLFLVSLIIPALIIKFCDKRLRELSERSPQQLTLLSRPIRKRRKVSDIVKNEINIEEEELITSKGKINRPSKLFLETEDATDLTDPSSGDHCDESPNEEVNLFSRVPLDFDDELETSKEIKLEKTHIQNNNLGQFQLFFFGLCTTLLLTGIGKITCGRLRPHFMQRCQPNIDCSDPRHINRYITDFNCTNPALNSRGLSYIATSWPSGHASIVFYSVIYMVKYLHSNIPILLYFSSQHIQKRFSPLIFYSVYVLMVGFAFFIAMTRVSDYHHHPLDVFSGAIIGFLVALVWIESQPKGYLLSKFRNSIPLSNR